MLTLACAALAIAALAVCCWFSYALVGVGYLAVAGLLWLTARHIIRRAEIRQGRRLDRSGGGR